jgi:glutamine amidotransferase
MCELLGLSSAHPVGLAKILHAFARRGGETADNPDGWGLPSTP